MGKHTPGPWLAMRGTESTGRHVSDWAVSDNIDAWICTGPSWDDEYEEESFANAHLIAAAPDLLEALTLLHDRSLNYADGRTHEELGVARTKAAAAIAKATGNDPL